jgi:peroxiredoxin
MTASKFSRLARSTSLLAIALVMTLALPAFAEGAAPDDNRQLLDPKNEQPGLAVGDKAPTLKLRNAQGEKVNLRKLYKTKGPVVIAFYRGGWCPFCNKELMSWSEKLDELADAGGTFIAISPETKQHAIETETKHGGQYVTLIDADGGAMRAFKLGFAVDEKTKSKYKGFGIDLDNWNSNGKWELPAPATFVIDKDGVVRWVFARWDYTTRADPDEVIAEVKKLTQHKN